MPRDYYEVLNVPRDASLEEIKAAYRRLAREYHPDVRKDLILHPCGSIRPQPLE